MLKKKHTSDVQRQAWMLFFNENVCDIKQPLHYGGGESEKRLEKMSCFDSVPFSTNFCKTFHITIASNDRACDACLYMWMQADNDNMRLMNETLTVCYVI